MDSSGAKRVMCTQPLKGKKGARQRQDCPQNGSLQRN
ncbi:hypothetical protein NC652_008762 [Populus alba x Populus x berolinensis]|nr:hypothetical protein NC652_008760 [Populus alba x Populus x berolinensis]KAJ6943062.1 hypothetical protein NC652_008762 [Populus alba x Populus x berolinensis]